MSDFINKTRNSCALGGALAAISSLPDVIPIVHTATGCGGNLMGSISFGAGFLGSSYCSNNSAPTSAITENEIVFGGNERLKEQIASTLKLIDGKLYIIATGCMTEMIGDDVGGVANEFASEGEPVLAISTPSFKGDSYTGYEILLEGIFNRYLSTANEKNNNMVNIFGVVPGYDPFFRGDLEEIERIGKELGLQVNTFFSPTQTFENITNAPKAALNIIFSRTRCREFAENFEEKHGTPFWITDLPIGPQATEEFIRELAKKLNLSDAENVIKKENELYYRYFERTVDNYADGGLSSYFAGVTNSNYAIPLAKYLHNELGWVLLESIITDELYDEQKENLLQGFSDLPVKPVFEGSTAKIEQTISLNNLEYRGERYFNAKTPLFIAGSTYERQTATKRGASFLPLSFPVNGRVIVTRGYAGYRGALCLYEDLIGAIMASKG